MEIVSSALFSLALVKTGYFSVVQISRSSAYTAFVYCNEIREVIDEYEEEGATKG